MQTKIKKESENFQVGRIGWSFIKVKRNSGYRYWTAIADLIDNSLDAGAEKIKVKLIYEGLKNSGLSEIHLVDDGSGMDYDTLEGSFTLGYERQRTNTQLGRFGVGGTEGPLSFASRKITLTRYGDSSKILAREYDLSVVQAQNAWGSIERLPTQKEQQLFEEALGTSSGTYIIMKDLDLITCKDVNKVKTTMIKHISTHFCEFLISGISISIDGDEVRPTDPLHWDSKGTIKMYGPESIPGYPGITLKISDVLETEGHTPSYKKQGGYIFRGDRLIVGSLTNGDKIQGFWDNDPHYRGVRWQLNFNADNDLEMGTTTRKDDINIQQNLMDKIREIVMPMAREARKREGSLAKKSPKVKTLNKATEVANESLVTRNLKKKIDEIQNDMDDNILPISKDQVLKEKFGGVEILLASFSEHGPLGRARLNEAKNGYKIEINEDNPFIQNFYLPAEEENQQKAILSLVISFLITEIEFDNSGEIYDFSNAFNNKVKVFSRKI